MTDKNLSKFCVHPQSTLRELIECFNKNQRGAALVVDENARLVDILTDGDLRRAMLAGAGLGTPIQNLKNRRLGSPYPQPISAPMGTPPSFLLDLMQRNSVRFIPLLDKENRVIDLVLLRDLLPEEALPLQAVIMAGGRGQRMRPLTETTPKPMLPVGDKPLLELTLQKLRAAGITNVHFSTHYKGDVISRYFGDGEKFGLDIRYIAEDRPLGTAGALRFMGESSQPLLIMNGDIVTQVDFRSMLDFHRENKADLTIGVRSYEMRIPFGVVETEGVHVTGFSEKPVLEHFINAGIYLMSPALCQFIPAEQKFDMPDLIKLLLSEGRQVVSFPIHEYWLDMGTHGDYELARKDHAKVTEDEK